MPSKSNNHGPAFDMSYRIDGYVNVWAWLPWPDDDLDFDHTRLMLYLRNTHGWRAYGWQVVHVAKTLHEAECFMSFHRNPKGA
jgi:hypothetical protein